jgi:hypothetical protein
VTSLILQLDDRYKITTDSSRMNLQLERLETVEDRKNGGTKEEWKLLGYFGLSLRALLRRYTDEKLIEMETTTMKAVLVKLSEINQTIDNVVKRENIVFDVKDNDQ